MQKSSIIPKARFERGERTRNITDSAVEQLEIVRQAVVQALAGVVMDHQDLKLQFRRRAQQRRLMKTELAIGFPDGQVISVSISAMSTGFHNIGQWKVPVGSE